MESSGRSSCAPRETTPSLGIMRRENGMPIVTTAQRRHNLYINNCAGYAGEYVNLPRPFVIGGTHVQSNVVVHVCDVPTTYASTQPYRVYQNGEPDSSSCRPTMLHNNSAVIYSFINPYIEQSAQTIDAIQGHTLDGGSIASLKNIEVHHELVSSTCITNIHQMYVVDVPNMEEDQLRRTRAATRAVTYQKSRDTLITRYAITRV